ncbi:uncharacterized protein LOC127106931 [Lathyrus oleraceus]|uniref:C2H2-type domain-containing protein n=1 Tax=Pisum sativum TaxID=3888 RepID=A0A9D4VNY5_PEA|nr:uncharacterized protein LOC127106931 [Pisum sativum]KAI5387330.1 hypothetical protein KIW84_073456 [Pisum sativum]
MEEKQRKFVCKYCFKRYPCGKSLGGHIRTHMSEQRTHNAAAIAVAAVAADARVFKLDGVRNKRDSETVGGADGNNSYGLRENPRKTMRFVHSHHHQHRRHDDHAAAAATTVAVEHEMIRFCKECGKGFPSSKALCGHMASHSEKEKKINRFDQVMEDSQSDDDDDDDTDDDGCAVAATMNLRKSKRRIRFKSLTLSNQNLNQIQNQPSSCSVNGSSSMSEMEHEQQEVAMCLMLLSRDFFSHKDRFVSESSDNNSSVVLETKPYISDKKIVIRNGNKFVSSNDHHEAAEKKLKLKSVGIGVSNKSDSKDFRYASKIKIVDSKVSNFEFKRPKDEEDKSGFVDCKSKYNVTTTTVVKKSGMNKDLDHDSRKNSNYEGFSFNNNNNKNEEIHEDVRNGLKYEFYGSEKDNDSSYVSTTDEESDEENSSESDSFTAAKSHNSKKKPSNKAKKKLKSKKSKEYECPICYKIFRSGQALGGHKRSHFVGGSEENTTFVIKQNAGPCLIDLNLPAPVDE